MIIGGERDTLRTQLVQAQNEALELAESKLRNTAKLIPDLTKCFNLAADNVRALKSTNSAEEGK